MSTENIKNIIKILGFKLKERSEGIWTKYYNDYEINVSIDEKSDRKSRVDYGNKIRCVRNTSSNLGQSESLVVLDCVNRLLEKGYKPENIILEKDWPLGHTKGFLDILVKDNSGKTFLMIECKTFGAEHRKERSKMFVDGGQLFSYFIQEKTTQYLCLYSSILKNNEIVFENDIIKISDSIASAKNQQEAFESWDPQVFEAKGIFEPEASPYNIKFTGILKKDLKGLEAQEGGYIFNRFAEILRKNVVSDKTNAFNKIFNLFLCKIVDESERSDEEQTQFQWRENEEDEIVMLRLNDLYKRGMDRYLGLKISAVTTEELNQELDRVSVAKQKEAIKELFIKQKLYSGNEFAFKEVFDKKSFGQNAVVAKEVVKLLEKYQIKYSTKQQFLGDFFEKLLNTGIKQESGQFFTPIPIARFICRSLPLWEVIDGKNKQREENFLPYVIDYASGSGHFLTEIMSEINLLLSKIDSSWIKGGDLAKKNFNACKDAYVWAKEYIYGIDKDYRLAKTTKISTFLNGDGDANIICGDGLANFKTSPEYKGKLVYSADRINNEQFDIVIANPPYSVSGFKNTLENGKNTFSLFDRLTEQSSEIECLFVERTAQLLKEGGCAGIILPVSLLTNTGIYSDTRKLLLKSFEIIGIVALGNNTFMKTGTNTIALFLRKRNASQLISIEHTVELFFRDYKDVACNNIEKAFSKYVSETLEGTNDQEYIEILNGNFTKLKDNRLLSNYRKSFRDNRSGQASDNDEIELLDFIRKNEKEKIICFILTRNRSVVLARSGEKTDEKKFLGYEFSNRRGYEGIKIYKDENGKIASSLYDEEVLDDEKKVNSYILKNFRGEQIDTIEPSLKGNVIVRDLSSLLDFSTPKFEHRIILSFEKKNKISSKYNSAPLINYCSIIDSGTNAPQGIKYFESGKHPFIRAGNLNKKDCFGYIIPDKESYINEKAIKECRLKRFKKGTILFPKSGQSINTNNIGMLKEESFVVNHLACLYDSDPIFLKYIYYYLEYLKTSSLVKIGSDYPSINLSDIRQLDLPIPPANVVAEIVEAMNKIENKTNNAFLSNLNIRKEIHSLFENIFNKHKQSFEKLEDNSILIQRGKSPKYGDSNLQIIKSGQARGYYDYDFSNRYYVSNDFIIDDRKLIEGDILINSTGVGTAGRVTYFNLPGDYVVDSHITIARTDKNKLLPKFLLYSLAHIGFKTLEKMAQGQSGQVELSLGIIQNLQIPRPNIKTQEVILKKISSLEKALAANNKTINDRKKTKEKILIKYLGEKVTVSPVIS